ncbi:uncharacterized protein LOC119670264 [Teleopsis dalmanni]|uniref:uncharacterized protein LOC119670264 n=1 Tax=Teleopsis dalmanni TaxID=139649 RepID=UPI0018CEAB20|nr:uncharacterized protein LOC119670264 [Teleopsis dalmanni]
MIRTIVFAYIAITALCWQFELTSSRTSTLWKLDSGKIKTGREDSTRYLESSNDIISKPFANDIFTSTYPHDEIFYIIATTLINDNTGWVRLSPETGLESLMTLKSQNKNIRNDSLQADNKTASVTERALELEKILDCGKPVNFTYYDYLNGVAQRQNHPTSPEAEVAYLFLKSKDENSFKNFDITVLERKLKRAKREKPRSVQLYNQIGNYWRIVGNARIAIECFRRALAMAPNNSEVLLNLARLLYNLQYLDDAIHLTRRSLDVKPLDQSGWEQYFTLGEIFRAYGHFQESLLHFRHALQLNPHHEPILIALREIENHPDLQLNIYTVIIIIALILAVLAVIFSPALFGESCNTQLSNGNEYEPKTLRHFNRAMAMRSLKGLPSSRNIRYRRS